MKLLHWKTIRQNILRTIVLLSTANVPMDDAMSCVKWNLQKHLQLPQEESTYPSKYSRNNTLQEFKVEIQIQHLR